MTSAKERIRALNDDLRQNHCAGLIVLTAGIQHLGAELVQAIDLALSRFDSFDEANDPYHEHDFGAVIVAGHVVFFKIDYFDLDLMHHSPDPSDPEVTRRVMTIMLAEEY